VEQSDLEFLIPADTDTYIDLDIKLFVRGKLVSGEGKDLDEKDFTAVTNNVLHSLFSQCNVTLNYVPITQSGDLYQYRSYFETLLTYGSVAAAPHLTNSFWYLGQGDMLPLDPSAADKSASATNVGFITRWDRIKRSGDVQLYDRLNSDLCNVRKYLRPGVHLHIKLTEARSSFYLMNATADSKTTFKFLDTKLFMKRIRPHPDLLSAHNTTLKDGGIPRHNSTRVELKAFTFATGSNSTSIDNLVLRPIPKRILFTMIKNTDFLGSMATNPFKLRHYDHDSFALYVNGKLIPSEGLLLGIDHEKTSII
jgi:hypothetical protein